MHFITFSPASIVKRGYVRALLVGLTLPVLAGAQSARDSALYSQAQQMVANGDAASGRKLADSVAAAAATGSVAYAEGLYWRATLAENARDSEHAYRQIIVDYPLSERVPDALLRIGQLESARGENAAALQHFQRLVLEHPQSPLHADASYWVARMYFDTNDAMRACAANADALASVRPSNIELKNRIDFQQQRCRGVALTTATPAPAVAAPVVKTPVVKAPAVEVPKVQAKIAAKADAEAPTPGRADSNVNATVGTKPPSKASPVVSRAPTREEVARALASAEQPIGLKTAKKKVSKTPLPKTPLPKTAKSEASSIVPRATPKPPGASEQSKAPIGLFGVQVAAFGTMPPATLLVAKLRGRGYNAYIYGTSAPYRVRIGHYPTREEAAAELVRLKARQIDGFVAER